MSQTPDFAVLLDLDSTDEIVYDRGGYDSIFPIGDMNL